MRRIRGLGLGLAVSLTPAAAFGQFAVDRTIPAPSPAPQVAPSAPSPSLSAALQPATPPASAPTTGITPAALSEPPATPAHPWAVRPENGGWFLCVKSYTGPQSKQLAEELASEIRTTQKAAAYLYEWGGEAKRNEELKRQKIRQHYAEREAPFLALREQLKAKAEAEGREFDEAPPTIRVPHVEYQEQWAVLVGGFKDMDAARKALDTVRRWPAPEGKPHLLDQAAVAGPGQKAGEAAYINPFATAMVVPNPSVRRSDPNQPPPVDPGLKRWNEKEELSLLRCPKGYTLFVKAFTVPTKTQTKDADPSAFGSLFGNSKGAEMLHATAQQARSLADALRHPDMKPQPFESYVLHVKTGSIVTVGGFDGPDDPELIRVHQILAAMTFQTSDRKGGPATGVQKVFDNVYPMAIPKVQ